MIARTASCPSSLSRPASALTDLLDHPRVDVDDQWCSGDQTFRSSHRERRLGGDSSAELQQPRLELIDRDDLRHEPSAQRILRIDESRLEQKTHRGLVTDQGRKRPRQPAVRRRARPQIARMQASGVGRDPDIRCHRQRESRTHRRSVDTSDHGLVRLEPQRQQEPPDPPLLIQDSLLLGQSCLRQVVLAATQVEARTERVAVRRSAPRRAPRHRGAPRRSRARCSIPMTR